MSDAGERFEALRSWDRKYCVGCNYSTAQVLHNFCPYNHGPLLVWADYIKDLWETV